jgi:hypothetical protein
MTWRQINKISLLDEIELVRSRQYRIAAESFDTLSKPRHDSGALRLLPSDLLEIVIERSAMESDPPGGE